MNKVERWKRYVTEHADKTSEQMAKIHRRLCRDAASLTGQAALADRLRRMKLREDKTA